jgi:ArsR family transcriptional regulator, arsenate/arsenite/antimonite-responsive transcriptional repressor
MEIKQAVVALAALAQESRLRVFRLLVPAGEAGIAAGEIAERLDIPPATLTFHLKELSHAGLIESRREGRSIIYSLRVEGMRGLLTFLARDCCKEQPELCGVTGKCMTKRRAKAASK